MHDYLIEKIQESVQKCVDVQNNLTELGNITDISGIKASLASTQKGLQDYLDFYEKKSFENEINQQENWISPVHA